MIFWGWGHRGKGEPQVFCCRPGDGTGDWFWRSRRGEDLQTAYLLPWQEGPLGYKWVPTGVGGKGKAMSQGGQLRGGELWDPQQMGAGGREGCHRYSVGELLVILMD